jgi:hypothetical protein
VSHHYLEARKALGLSREKLSGLAKRAGISVSAGSIAKLESEGEKAIGSRGLGPQVVGYLNYVLGIGDFEATNWSSVEKGAPVIVAGEKGTFSYVSVNDDGSVLVFGQNFRSFTADRVRLIAPTALPPTENAALFEVRTRGGGGAYAQEVMTYVSAHPSQPHSVGALAYALGRDNGLVSRTVAGLVKAGKLQKVGRGVVTLPATSAASEAVSEAPAAATAAVAF